MIHYFDYASTTFRKPKVVYKAVKAYKKYGVNLSRGNNQNKCKEIVSKTRDNIRKIVGADDSYEVAFCQSATYMINQVLKGLDHSKIKTIYISQFEHNSIYRVVNRIKEEYGTFDTSAPTTHKEGIVNDGQLHDFYFVIYDANMEDDNVTFDKYRFIPVCYR